MILMDKKKLKIFLSIDWYCIGGIEVFGIRLAKSLFQDNEVILFIAYYDKPPNFLKDFIPDVEIILVPHWQAPYLIWKTIKAKKPNIVHINNISKTGIVGTLSAKKNNISLIITNHQAPEYKFWYSFLKPILWWFLILFDNLADAVIAPSVFIAEFLIKHGVSKPVQTISCGVDTLFFKPGDKQLAKQNIHLPLKPTILYVGRFDKGKGIDLIVKSAPEIIKK